MIDLIVELILQIYGLNKKYLNRNSTILSHKFVVDNLRKHWFTVSKQLSNITCSDFGRRAACHRLALALQSIRYQLLMGQIPESRIDWRMHSPKRQVARYPLTLLDPS